MTQSIKEARRSTSVLLRSCVVFTREALASDMVGMLLLSILSTNDWAISAACMQDVKRSSARSVGDGRRDEEEERGEM